MKRILLSFTLLSTPLLHAQTPFTYQGKLESQGAPHNGVVNIRLGLYSLPVGGILFRTEVVPNVSVSNGIFTAVPLSFGPADFTGAARYLNIEISPDGVNYTALTPRQQVTWSPYAYYASTAASATVASAVTGTVQGSQLTGTISPSLLGTGSIPGTLTFNPGAGAPFSVGANGTVVTNLNADRLDGFSSADFLRVAGGTLTGDVMMANPATLSFGNSVRQMINLYNETYAIGIQANTLYQRSSDDWSWHRGGTHSDVRNDAGGGAEAMRLIGASSTLWVRPQTTNTPRGRVIFGDLNLSSQPRAGIGESQADDDVLELYGSKVKIVSNQAVPNPTITFGQTTGQHLVLYEGSADTYGLGVQSSTMYFRTGEQFAWYKDGAHNDTANSSGGGLTVMTMNGTGTLTVKGPENGYNVTNRNNSNQQWAMYSRNSGATGQLAFWTSDSGDVAAFSPNGDMYLVGQLSTSVLTIRGGADVAEPFETTNPEELEPGTVVVIDEENPGKLKKSDGAYDTRVAGIISGAGGVKPGLRLHQEGVMEGDHHVALSGRVYVKADAESGRIKPGDLLTTSPTAGHAMKVKDPIKAQGAILGKAMSKLDKGTGLVLVLVTLQ